MTTNYATNVAQATTYNTGATDVADHTDYQQRPLSLARISLNEENQSIIN